MHLYGKFSLDVKELYQKRELTAIIIIDILTYDSFNICLHQLAYGISRKPAFLHHRILETHIRNLPALSDSLFRSENRLVSIFIAHYELLSELCHERISTPWSSGRDRHELQRV